MLLYLVQRFVELFELCCKDSGMLVKNAKFWNIQESCTSIQQSCHFLYCFYGETIVYIIETLFRRKYNFDHACVAKRQLWYTIHYTIQLYIKDYIGKIFNNFLTIFNN